jgi:hypothetical protein
MFRNRKTKASRYNSGQSTVEYIVLVGAVIAAILLFFGANGGPFKSKINATYGVLTNEISARGDNVRDRQDNSDFNPALSGLNPNLGVNAEDTNSAFNIF